MIKIIGKALISLLIVVGVIICIVNFTSNDLNAGSITKAGSYEEGEPGCPGDPSNCLVVYYVEDDPPDSGTN